MKTPTLLVKRNGQEPKDRKVSIFGFPTGPNPYNVHKACITNTTTSLLERVLFIETDDGQWIPPPQPLLFNANRTRHRVEPHLNALANRMKITKPTKLDPQQFVESYHGRKKTIYENARVSLVDDPLTVEDADLKLFVKLEKIKTMVLRGQLKDPAMLEKDYPSMLKYTKEVLRGTISDPMLDPENLIEGRKPPRNISPRSPRYNLELGRYIKPLEHCLYGDINNYFGEKVVFKGMNVFQMGSELRKKWSRFKNPLAVMIDASRFDQSITRSLLRWEHSVYRRYFPGDVWFQTLLSRQLDNKMTAYNSDGSAKVKGVNIRCSGDMNTACGNVLIMVSLIFAYLNWKEMSKENFSIFDNGDDAGIIIEAHNRSMLNDMSDFFLLFGIRIKIECETRVFEKIEFCQMQPVFDGKYWRMVRQFPNCLYKDVVSVKDLPNAEQFDRWVSAVGECGLALTSGLPVVQNYYRKFVKGKATVNDMAQSDGFFHMASKVRPGVFTTPTDAARASFAVAFDIPPEVQRLLEHQYDNLEPPSFYGDFNNDGFIY